MNKKSFKIILGVILIAALAAGLGCAPKTDPQAGTGKKTGTGGSDPYKIGVVLSLTGDYSGLGGPEKNALQMEAEKLNKAGGVNGHPIELIFEDDGTDNNKAVTAVSKLIDKEQVICVIGASGTGQTMAMRGNIEKAGVPNISMAAGNAVADPVNKWVFQIPWPNKVMVGKIIDFLKTQKINKVALLTVTDGFGKDGLAVLEKMLPEAGLTVSKSETFNPTDLDMKSQLTNIKSSDAEALIVWSAGKAPAIIAKNVQELKIAIPLINSHGVARKEFLEGAGDAANGTFFPSGKIILPESYGEGNEARTLADNFIAEYTAKYGEAPNGTFPGHGFDSLHMLARALERLKLVPAEVTPEKLRDELEKTNGLVLLGGVFTYTAADHAGTKASDVIMIKVVGGKWTEIK